MDMDIDTRRGKERDGTLELSEHVEEWVTASRRYAVITLSLYLSLSLSSFVSSISVSPSETCFISQAVGV